MKNPIRFLQNLNNSSGLLVSSTYLQVCVFVFFSFSILAMDNTVQENKSHNYEKLILIDQALEKVFFEFDLDDGKSLIECIDSKESLSERIRKIFLSGDMYFEVHLLSHGFEGGLMLGSEPVLLHQIKDAVTGFHHKKRTPMVYLYGCNVGKGKAGIDFLSGPKS